jgi:hypothetical protein
LAVPARKGLSTTQGNSATRQPLGQRPRHLALSVSATDNRALKYKRLVSAQCEGSLFQHHSGRRSQGVFDWRQRKRLSMNKVKQLSECVDALCDVRRSLQDDADSRILAALDEAIAKLQRCRPEDESDVAEATLRGFAIVSDILTCVTTIADLMKFLGN